MIIGGDIIRLLKLGSSGPAVELLQLALNRAGCGPLALDGRFGGATRAALVRFQAENGLRADGIVGQNTHRALMPWYTGYIVHKIFRGESIYSIAQMYSTSTEAIFLANPGIDPLQLQPGRHITVPLPFDVVPTNISYSSDLIALCVQGLAARYPFIKTGEIGRSVMGRPIWRMTIGSGQNRVLYNASHHANEWITTPILLKFAEQLAAAFAAGDQIASASATDLLNYAAIHLIPAVNPDGIDLAAGELTQGEFYTQALRIGNKYPSVPFPSGWKANIEGIDLNLQYPAGWEQAKENKFALGITSPAPLDFVGTAPLNAPESRAMYDYTLALAPSLILAYHTQGEVIYWRFLDFNPPNSRAIADSFSALSGYAVEDTPFSSGFAGYKDWFIQNYDRPGYTIEAGLGTNPLPISDFDEIYRKNLGILVNAALLT